MAIGAYEYRSNARSPQAILQAQIDALTNAHTRLAAQVKTLTRELEAAKTAPKIEAGAAFVASSSAKSVDATRAREHLHGLRADGVRNVHIARVTGLGVNGLSSIYTGKRATISGTTEALILAVRKENTP